MKNNEQRAFLKYNFLIDPNIWASVFDFENWMEKSLEAIGAQGQMLNNIKGYSGFEKVVHITKKEPDIPEVPKPIPQGTPAQILKEIAGPTKNEKPRGRMVTAIIKPKQRLSAPQYRFKKGRFLSRKGYLQRKG